MKISTLRKLLILLDVLLVAGIGGVVWKGLQEKERSRGAIRSYGERILARLAETRSDAGSRQGRAEYGGNIMAAQLAGRKPEEAAPPTEVKAPDPTKPPLDSIVQVVGIQKGPESGDPPSMAFLVRKGVPIRPEDALKEPAFYVEGQVVEYAHGAFVKRIESYDVPNGPQQLRVIFEYDGKEVILLPQPFGPGAGGAANGGPGVDGRGGGAASAIASAPITEDPGTWVSINPGSSAVSVTPSGVRSMAEKGDSVLEGVRWSTDRLDDGKPAVRIDALPQGNVLARGGAQQGDIIESINGKRMTSKADIINYVRSNPNLPRYEVRFRRQGRIHVRVVTVPR